MCGCIDDAVPRVPIGVTMNEASVSCVICARVADPAEDGDPPLGWCADVVESRGGPRTRWICPSCTRANVRSIEAKLEAGWW